MFVSAIQRPPKIDFERWQAGGGINLGERRLHQYLLELDENFGMLSHLADRWLRDERFPRYPITAKTIAGIYTRRQKRQVRAMAEERTLAFDLLSQAIARRNPVYITDVKLMAAFFAALTFRSPDTSSFRRLERLTRPESGIRKYEKHQILRWNVKAGSIYLIRPTRQRWKSHAYFLENSWPGLFDLLKKEGAFLQKSGVFWQTHHEDAEFWMVARVMKGNPKFSRLPTTLAVALLAQYAGTNHETSRLASKFVDRKEKLSDTPSTAFLEALYHEMTVLSADLNKVLKRDVDANS